MAVVSFVSQDTEVLIQNSAYRYVKIKKLSLKGSFLLYNLSDIIVSNYYYL